jgi:hypothetical protein
MANNVKYLYTTIIDPQVIDGNKEFTFTQIPAINSYRVRTENDNNMPVGVKIPVGPPGDAPVQITPGRFIRELSLVAANNLITAAAAGSDANDLDTAKAFRTLLEGNDEIGNNVDTPDILESVVTEQIRAFVGDAPPTLEPDALATIINAVVPPVSPNMTVLQRANALAGIINNVVPPLGNNMTTIQRADALAGIITRVVPPSSNTFTQQDRGDDLARIKAAVSGLLNNDNDFDNLKAFEGGFSMKSLSRGLFGSKKSKRRFAKRSFRKSFRKSKRRSSRRR